jgi:hypothetical protein
MVADDDWRLTWEADWMHGAKLERRRFTAPTADWDHEHCVLCQSKFSDRPDDDAIREGYVRGYDRTRPLRPLEERTTSAPPDAPAGFDVAVEAPTTECWICPTCFVHFRERFNWSAIEPTG